MNFQENVKKILGTYRKEQLGIEETGIFRYRGRDLLKDHILPKKHANHNIISQYRDDFFSSSKSQINFHKYFHHLNSSQALCINLFFPLIVEKQIDIILEILEIPQNTVINACFEKESDIEKVAETDRKTNFDFFLQLDNNLKVYFEIKYSESEFGKAKNDEEHIVKFSRTYQPLLRNNSFIRTEYKDMDTFLGSYQIMRNLVHLNYKNFVVFLYPEANRNIHRQAQIAYESILSDNGKERFKILLLEKVIDDIMKRIKTNKLLDHYKEFKNKYLHYITK